MTSNRARSGLDDVTNRLHSAAVHLLRRVRDADAASGLSGPRASALSVVVFAGPISLGNLARAEQVRPPTMTHLVTALEREGLVRRSRDPEDARAIRIIATRHGVRVLQQAREQRIAAVAELLAELRPGERRALHRAVTALERLLGEAHPRLPVRERATSPGRRRRATT